MSLPSQQEPDKSKIALPDYPLYPINNDIFNQLQMEDNINSEDISTMKEEDQMDGNEPNEKDFEDDISGNDLDVPGSELDDEDEAIGSEDEENNYYSLGGDNHDNLEEDNG